MKRYGVSEIRYRRSDWINVSVAVCCFVTSGAYFGEILWEVVGGSRSFECLDWVSDVGGGVVWVTLAVSVLVERWKLVRILSSVWWMLVFVLMSVIGIEKLVEKRGMLGLEYVEWVVSFLLLICALRNVSEFVTKREDAPLLDPLLVNGTDVGNTSEVEEPSFFSKLVFSWVNPLVLEDIPSLATKDQARVAYEQFKIAWDLLQSEKTSNGVKLVGRALQRVYGK